MLRTTRSTVSAAAILVLWTAACTDVPGPAAPAAPIPEVSPGVIASPVDAVAREVPAFGGFFLDENGTPTAYLTDVSQRTRLERALAPVLREHGLDAAQLQVRPAAFRHQELQRWFSDATPEVLGLPGVVFIDNDEANNRLLIGVEHPGAAGLARAAAARLRIPDAAVSVIETEPIAPAVTLRDRVRPIQGGLQIHFSNFLCTLGFNAIRSGQNSFITNSHCTERQGGVEGTDYFQPLSTVDPAAIGVEVADPTYFTGSPCPSGRRCRFSDSSRATYTSGISFDLGGIARTASRGSLSGSLEIVGTFNITAEQANPVAGAQANKVGRTTGWTFGTITNTCVNVAVSGTNIVQLCQSFVNAGVGGGDSGSPVFAWPGTGDNVTLLGILWGGNSSGTQFVFSPMSGIERELGSLTTF
ncbi:MAG TPA: hypothetical protein VIL18_12775 [Longimicrobiales bacterium]